MQGGRSEEKRRTLLAERFSTVAPRGEKVELKRKLEQMRSTDRVDLQESVYTPRAMQGEFRWKDDCPRPRVGPMFIEWKVEELAGVGATN